jgi:hypothetical protein
LVIGLSATHAALPVPTLRIFSVGRATPFHQPTLDATGMDEIRTDRDARQKRRRRNICIQSPDHRSDMCDQDKITAAKIL